MQIFSNGKAVGGKTVQHLRDFISQSSATQAEKGEQIVSMMPAI